MKQLSKIQKIFIFFVLSTMIFTPLFSYAFDSLNFKTNTNNIKLQENNTKETNNHSLLINNLTPDNSSNNQTETEDEIKLNLPLNFNNNDIKKEDSEALNLNLDTDNNNDDNSNSVNLEMFSTKNDLIVTNNTSTKNIEIKTKNNKEENNVIKNTEENNEKEDKNNNKIINVDTDLFVNTDSKNKIKIKTKTEDTEKKQKESLKINAKNKSEYQKQKTNTKTQNKQEEKKQNTEKNKNENIFQGILDIQDIRKNLKLETKNKTKYQEKENKEDEESLEFIKQIDKEKSLKNILEKKQERINQLCQALDNAKKENILNSCKAYYSKLIDDYIVIYYNESKLYEDRAKKIMIAFELWSQTTEVPEMVNKVMNKAFARIKKNGEKARYALSHSMYGPHDTIENETRLGDNIHFKYCYYVEAACEEDFNKSGVTQAEVSVENQRWWIKNMKIIIEEFTKDNPFGKTFLLNLGCAFDHSYVENLPPEEYHYCNKNKNPFYHH